MYGDGGLALTDASQVYCPESSVKLRGENTTMERKVWLPFCATSYTVVRVSFRISTPDLLQNTKKVTGESTVWFSCMVQCRMNLLPAYGVLSVGETMVTVGVGTVKRNKLGINKCLRNIGFNQNTTLYIIISTKVEKVYTQNPPLIQRVYIEKEGIYK